MIRSKSSHSYVQLHTLRDPRYNKIEEPFGARTLVVSE